MPINYKMRRAMKLGTSFIIVTSLTLAGCGGGGSGAGGSSNAGGISPPPSTGGTTNSSSSLSLLAGNMAVVGGKQDGTGSIANFFGITSIATDTTGNVYVADTNNHTIRKITPAGVVTTLAGTAGVIGSADGSGATARFNSPAGIATDSAGNIYVADTSNHTIRKITQAGVVTTLAGTAGVAATGLSNWDGTGAAARFFLPQGIGTDAAGNVYVGGNQGTLRKITPAGVVTTLAGSAGVNGSTDGAGAAASFSIIRGVVVDTTGNIFVTDGNNYTIRKITPAGTVTTLAGTAGQLASVDGTGAAARFKILYGISIDAANNLYVADTGNFTIRKITPAGAVTTVAGIAGMGGLTTLGVSPTTTTLFNPKGVAVNGTSLFLVSWDAVLTVNPLP